MDWQKLTIELEQEFPKDIKPWMTEAYILTRHLRLAKSSHNIKLHQQKWQQDTWVREISHVLAGKPVVMALVDVPKATYDKISMQIGNLSDKPLGETLLYHSDSVTRSEFLYAKLTEAHLVEMFSQEINMFGAKELWARRSTFYWQGMPLTITEVFLPTLPEFKPINKSQQALFMLKQKSLDYIRLIRLHRPIPILLLLWPTLMGLWIAAQGFTGLKLLWIFLAGTIIMRSAGDIFNDIADRNLDGKVLRTHMRPLAIGRIKTRNAVVFALILVLLSLALVLMLNIWSIAFAAIGLCLAVVYPLMKRFTYWPQLILGMAYNWGILLAFTAVYNEPPTYIAWLLWVGAVFWTIAYDSMYALADVEDDKKLKLKSTAILFGDNYHYWIALFQLLTLLCFSIIGFKLGYNCWYYLAVLLTIPLFAFEHKLIKDKKASNCIRAFSHNHWVGLLLFVIIALQYGFL